MRRGLFTELLARNGLAASELADGRRQAGTQFQFQDGNGSGNTLVVNGNLQMPIANAVTPAPLANSATGAVYDRQQPVAQQSPAKPNAAQNENGQQTLSGTNTYNGGTLALDNGTLAYSNGTLAANVAQSGSARKGESPPASQIENGPSNGKFVGSPGGAGTGASNQSVANTAASARPPNKAGLQLPAEVQAGGTLDLAAGQRRGGGTWYYYECDAAPDQLEAVMKQLGERREDFSKPEFAASLNDALGNNVRGGVEFGTLGTNQPVGGPALSPVQAKEAVSQQSSGDVRAVPAADLKAEIAPQRQVRSTADQPASPQPRQANQSAAASKTHVVFVLNVVDRVAPPPAVSATPPAAEVMPAKGK
jgi:hypothetical protein